MLSQATRTRTTVDLTEFGFDADTDVAIRANATLAAPDLADLNLSTHVA